MAASMQLRMQAHIVMSDQGKLSQMPLFFGLQEFVIIPPDLMFQIAERDERVAPG